MPWCPRREAETRAAIGLGSNVGDRLGNLSNAAGSLSRLGRLIARSAVWETAPIGPDQADFLNGVVVLDTLLGPRPLLDGCLAIEQAMGRLRRERWGPRLIDLDLLLYSDAVLDGPGLTVPHPRMKDRRFVLAPLAEASPGAEIPGVGRVEDLLAALDGQEAVRTDLGW